MPRLELRRLAPRLRTSAGWAAASTALTSASGSETGAAVASTGSTSEKAALAARGLRARPRVPRLYLVVPGAAVGAGAAAAGVGTEDAGPAEVARPVALLTGADDGKAGGGDMLGPRKGEGAAGTGVVARRAVPAPPAAAAVEALSAPPRLDSTALAKKRPLEEGVTSPGGESGAREDEEEGVDGAEAGAAGVDVGG